MTITRRAVIASVTLVLLVMVTALAQQPPVAPVFQTTTSLVQVNVVALDKHGKPVADLKREEFQIHDNGVLQEIGLFAGQGDSVAQRPPELSAALSTTNAFTNLVAPSSGLQSGYTVILIDNLYSGSDPVHEEGVDFSRMRALQMLRSAPPGERIAIYAPGTRFQVICEFTTDRDLLERELRKWKGTATTPAPESRPNLQSLLDPQARAMQDRATADMAVAEGQAYLDIGDFQLSALADHLSGIPGRKKLIWLANKFPIGGKAFQKLSGAGVSIYPVDIDGVCRLCPERPRKQMEVLAGSTGGVAYYDRNDISAAMLEAMDDGKVSYTLGFYPSGGDEGAAPVHRLAISVSRPGVTLRYGPTYQRVGPLPVTLSAVDLGQAINRPIDATAIPVRASVTKVRDRLSLDVIVSVESLDLMPDQDRWTGKIEFAARFTTADAIVAGEPLTRTVSFNLTREKYDATLRSGITYRHEMQVPPKAVELKLLFANTVSGKIGTLTIPLSRLKAESAGRR